jgi:hypothetical protein
MLLKCDMIGANVDEWVINSPLLAIESILVIQDLNRIDISCLL